MFAVVAMQRWRGTHGFGCVEQMQGQMHVHVTEMRLPVPLLGHFFCHLLDGSPRFPPEVPTSPAPDPATTAEVFPFP
ncbi:hypothetical protein D9753_15710 [Streptomyces dangxiongensis]|uniref:Uncharacterized protein n=1 Tax=Streptomyces dangxiongensis TaxID=1442032 RepID=A0A3G2JHL3_9ACTN|nr:hypothetical protein D9753_15710 [Streptomyces dangxiongensis]